VPEARGRCLVADGLQGSIYAINAIRHYETNSKKPGQESNVLPRKRAAGAERGSLEPGCASLPGQAGRQLAAGTWRPTPAHKSMAVPDLSSSWFIPGKQDGQIVLVA